MTKLQIVVGLAIIIFSTAVGVPIANDIREYDAARDKCVIAEYERGKLDSSSLHEYCRSVARDKTRNK